MTTRKEVELYLQEIEKRLKYMKILGESETLRLESIKPDRERLYRIMLCDNRTGGCTPLSGFYSLREIEAAAITTTNLVRIIQARLQG